MGRRLIEREEIKKRLALVAQAVAKPKTPDEVQDLTALFGLLSIFLGCSLCWHVGVSFLVCGVLIFMLAIGAGTGRK